MGLYRARARHRAPMDGLVDAYYGPPELAARIAAEPPRPPKRLVSEARALVAAIDGGAPLDDPDGSDTPTGRACAMTNQIRPGGAGSVPR